ncbi:hypothetical protein EW145_g1208 [Phellinidium pouzarii]|uniref:DNA 3'-5' helicase n=1 Tax=Phellinidium pouzarii TaxID=167371 RepID=A0A4S4LH58_9AGAM|nr:hypothetical protein EW145_g1208 [Phellinidium pouzarii]
MPFALAFCVRATAATLSEKMSFKSDHVTSDMGTTRVLAYTLQDVSGSFGSHATTSVHKNKSAMQPEYTRQELNGRLASLDAELKEVDEQIEKLRKLRSKILAERQSVINELNTYNDKQPSALASSAIGKGKAKAVVGAIDYMEERFEWSGELRARMQTVFRIENFRLCQEGVCNANMDGRDIVCVMPTGGGKSLTYQLPALLNPGCTLVISPLISLITDQILHLREFGVEAVKLTGSTSKEESRDIFSRMAMTAGIKNKGNYNNGPVSPEIKLCYVTPEKIAKSKTFTSMLEKVVNAGKLARIVIDEAHCVSQLGHDFRPDYKKLSILRQLYPRVPILALSATCPPKVLKDLITTLRLKPVVACTAANADGTIYFSAPLYRKNLHYKVLPKPSSAGAVIKTMTEYILDYHQGDSGIVYCLSKKDTENVARGLSEESAGKIRTGVYHADVHDREKEALHKRWHNGDVKVVCATIAFGLGIDKGDVRFVLHHSMSKSVEGYYQESGRAGRDGRDSDCILYYRPQDASRLSSLVCGEIEGQDKLQDMLRYFSTASSLSMSAWGTAESDAHARCGHCDNCTRPPESVERRDVTLAAWQILQVTQTIERDGGRVTLGMLADLVRGVGGGAYGVSGGGGKRGKGKAKEKVELDLGEIAGGKVKLGKDETEALLVSMLLSHHLKESFHSTAYAINVYVLSGANAFRLARHSREDVEDGKGPRITVAFLKKPSKKRGDGDDSKQASGSRIEVTNRLEDSFDKITGEKRKRIEVLVHGSELEDDFIEDNAEAMSLYVDDGDDEAEEPRRLSEQSLKRPRTTILISEEEEDDGWQFTLGEKSKTKPKSMIPSKKEGEKNLYSNGIRERTSLKKAIIPATSDVIEILSDSN